MKITVLCTDADHPVNDWLMRWKDLHHRQHDIYICRDRQDLCGGDVLFLVSCSQIINAKYREKYRHVLVLHASDLPKGRGWSPHIWALLEGEKTITVSLLDAEDSVDTGAIWAKRTFEVPAHALHDEIHELLFDTELALMDQALLLVADGKTPAPQSPDVAASYYPKRSPTDSEVDPAQPLSELFNTIRVMDPSRYPAYFQLHGHIYTIEMKKVSPNDD
ncbi:methionyl-tRNA formyltransferase [Onishia taeanensis]|uniref:Methionyl-tRNA formyltransferase n=1 Tax=Onishia taeanensis TaxID=284577 RepID=A0A328XDC4_9GAMM|nr:formyltransferase family protein [Halomonas taeanensis]RAR56780.1 methionyl-tRNA formyltransferase [Halomonas taeanensis]